MTTLKQLQHIGQTQECEERNALPWGYKYLMCPPDYFAVSYEINPWMRRDIPIDLDLAHEQWCNLTMNIIKAGATIETIKPVSALPDMVFVANAGLINKRHFIASRFRHPERQPEARYGSDWFRSQGYEVVDLPVEAHVCFEGCGDALPFRDHLLAGYGMRSDCSAHPYLAQLLGTEVLSIKLIDPRVYHLDLSFCPLDERRAIIAPDFWDRRSCKLVEALVREPLVLDADEALTFCANALVIGRTIIMHACPTRVERILNEWGFDICISPVSEFLKAGGSVRCLTLALDLSFSNDEAGKPLMQEGL